MYMKKFIMSSYLLWSISGIGRGMEPPTPAVAVTPGAVINYEDVCWGHIYTEEEKKYEEDAYAGIIRKLFVGKLFTQLERLPPTFRDQLFLAAPPAALSHHYEHFLHIISNKPLAKEVFNLLVSSYDGVLMFMMALPETKTLAPSIRRIGYKFLQSAPPGSAQPLQHLIEPFIESFFEWLVQTNTILDTRFTSQQIWTQIVDLFNRVIESVAVHAQEICAPAALLVIQQSATEKGIGNLQDAIREQLVDYFFFMTTNDAYLFKWWSPDNPKTQTYFLSKVKTTLSLYNGASYTATKIDIPEIYQETRTTLRTHIADLLAWNFISRQFRTIPLESISRDQIYFDMFKKLAAYLTVVIHYPTEIATPESAPKRPEAGTKLGTLYDSLERLKKQLSDLSNRLHGLKIRGVLL